MLLCLRLMLKERLLDEAAIISCRRVMSVVEVGASFPGWRRRKSWENNHGRKGPVEWLSTRTKAFAKPVRHPDCF